MQTVRFEGWERDTDVAEHAWTNFFMAGDGHEDDYDLVVIGEPDDDAPVSCEVIGFRNGNQVVIFHSIEHDFETACTTAEVQARRAAIRLIERKEK
ncbi:hypothetical protein [Agrobacterium tumefaciens]|uniref:hypothetical protein n=1 Tax=Agrobacterium tumefaciens TaxID=358 RepID=UPI001146392D